jgi:hypothetical protein
MIKGHHASLLRRFLTTKQKKNKVCPREFNKTKISPEKCLLNEKETEYCVCKRRRKDIDLTIKNKHGSNLLQCQQEVNL